jgi:hypothetical protein
MRTRYIIVISIFIVALLVFGYVEVFQTHLINPPDPIIGNWSHFTVTYNYTQNGTGNGNKIVYVDGYRFYTNGSFDRYEDNTIIYSGEWANDGQKYTMYDYTLYVDNNHTIVELDNTKTRLYMPPESLYTIYEKQK